MGKELVSEVISGTGLPEDLINNEFSALLKKHGKTAETMTLDDLREIMAEYLQDVLVDAKKHYR